MSKKGYIALEIIKLFVLSWLVVSVYQVLFASIQKDSDLSVVGFAFLTMLGTVILGSIFLDILLSFFLPREKNSAGEWEKIINKNILRNFAYVLSVFFVLLMIGFAFEPSLDTIILLLKTGFFVLIATTNLTKAYYYVG